MDQTHFVFLLLIDVTISVCLLSKHEMISILKFVNFKVIFNVDVRLLSQ